MTDTTGLTKDAGWELGVRTTVGASQHEVWAFLLGDGLPIWLGPIGEIPTTKGAKFATADGVRGTIRGYTDNYRIRLSWQPSDWPHDTILQLTVKQVKTGTTIAIHQEKLADRDERRMMLGHWKSVSDSLAAHFDG